MMNDVHGNPLGPNDKVRSLITMPTDPVLNKGDILTVDSEACQGVMWHKTWDGRKQALATFQVEKVQEDRQGGPVYRPGDVVYSLIDQPDATHPDNHDEYIRKGTRLIVSTSSSGKDGNTNTIRYKIGMTRSALLDAHTVSGKPPKPDPPQTVEIVRPGFPSWVTNILAGCFVLPGAISFTNYLYHNVSFFGVHTMVREFFQNNPQVQQALAYFIMVVLAIVGSALGFHGVIKPFFRGFRSVFDYGGEILEKRRTRKQIKASAKESADHQCHQRLRDEAEMRLRQDREKERIQHDGIANIVKVAVETALANTRQETPITVCELDPSMAFSISRHPQPGMLRKGDLVEYMDNDSPVTVCRVPITKGQRHTVLDISTNSRTVLLVGQDTMDWLNMSRFKLIGRPQSA